jgi:hypothetical protein
MRSQQIAFWSLVGLFLALEICWIVVPGIYFHYHPVKPWPDADYGPPIWWTQLFWIALFTGIGVAQLRLVREIENEIAKFLLWLFLVLGTLFLIDDWVFSLAVRFWTIQGKPWSHFVQMAYEISTHSARYFFYGSLATGLSNLGFCLFRKRSAEPL